MNSRRSLSKAALVALACQWSLVGWASETQSPAAREGKIQYVRENIPEFEIPRYRGKTYKALVPATLDLAERARLAINALTRTGDPQWDHENYIMTSLGKNPPYMFHRAISGPHYAQPKYVETLPLMRIMTGSDYNLEVDRVLMQSNLHMSAGEDGLFYAPLNGRPWSRKDPLGTWPSPPEANHVFSSYSAGRALLAFSLWGKRDPESPIWREFGQRLVDGIRNLTIDKGDYAYFPIIPGQYYSSYPGEYFRFYDSDVFPADGEMSVGFGALSSVGPIIQGCAQYYKVYKYEPARILAEKMVRYLQIAHVFDERGGFIAERAKDSVNPAYHFHHYTIVLLGMLDLAEATGNQQFVEFVKRSYEWAKTKGSALVGFYPEFFFKDGSPYGLAETCEVAEMAVLAVKLSLADAGDYWDDADRIVRNHLAEAQMTHSEWMIHTTQHLPVSTPGYNETMENVPARTVGCFAGWTLPNDMIQHPPGLLFMNCCTANGSRALYYIWENVLKAEEDTLWVNLLLNRASPWVDVNSHIPYTGQVDLLTKRSFEEVRVRIPEWVEKDSVMCRVNDLEKEFEWEGQYAVVEKVKSGKTLTMTFSIHERTVRETIEGQSYTFTLKGNTVVQVSPQGRYYPFYQRGHYRQNAVLWNKVKRFVSEETLEW